MEELKKKINDLIDNYELINRSLMENFFNILFWKDFSEGYLNTNDKFDIFKEINESTKKSGTDIDTYYTLDTKKIIPFINKIRSKIGLPNLTLELNHCLMEMTPEVKKEIMLKRLK